MKNYKIEIGLIVIAWILIAVNFFINLHQGLSRADIFNHSCGILLVLLWTASAIIRSKSAK